MCWGTWGLRGSDHVPTGQSYVWFVFIDCCSVRNADWIICFIREIRNHIKSWFNFESRLRSSLKLINNTFKLAYFSICSNRLITLNWYWKMSWTQSSITLRRNAAWLKWCHVRQLDQEGAHQTSENTLDATSYVRCYELRLHLCLHWCHGPLGLD